VHAGYQLLLLDDESLAQMGISETSARAAVLDSIRDSVETPTFSDGATAPSEAAGENHVSSLTRLLQSQVVSDDVTDEQGRTSVSAPTPGPYMVMAECSGYVPRVMPPFFIYTSCDEPQVAISLTPKLHSVVVVLDTACVENKEQRTPAGNVIYMQVFNIETARKQTRSFITNNQVKWLLAPGAYMLNRCTIVRVPAECPDDAIKCNISEAAAIRFTRLILSGCACRIQRVYLQWHERLLLVRASAAAIIQALCRGFSGQLKFSLQRHSTVLLQTKFRQCTSRKKFRLLSLCAIVIQSQYRSKKARQLFDTKRCSACYLQRIYRNFSRHKDTVQRASGAFKLQSVWRARCQQMIYGRQRAHIIAIQCSVRSWLACRNYKAISSAFNLSATIVKYIAPAARPNYKYFAIQVSEYREEQKWEAVALAARIHTTAFMSMEDNGVLDFKDTNDFDFVNTCWSQTLEFSLIGIKDGDPNLLDDGSLAGGTTLGRALFSLKGLAGSGGRYTLAFDAPNSTKAKGLVDALGWDRTRGCRRRWGMRYRPACVRATAAGTTAVQARYGCVTFELNAERRLSTGSLGMWYERCRLLESPLDLCR
jgi:hypothetical protein